jgi:HSP20 family protein
MSLIKYNPINELDAITRRFDNLFDSFRPVLESGVTSQQAMFYPKVDIHEDERNIYFDVELPGLKRNDVKISVGEDRYLIIKGERYNERLFEGNNEITDKKDTLQKKHTAKKSTKECQPLRIERSYGSFLRTFTLPENVDAEHINAIFEAGVLEIKVPKKEVLKPKHIDVSIN